LVSPLLKMIREAEVVYRYGGVRLVGRAVTGTVDTVRTTPRPRCGKFPDL